MNRILDFIDYSTKGDVFEKLSEDELRTLLEKYYSGNTTLLEIKKKYNFNISPNSVRKQFPKLKINGSCDRCNSQQYIELPVKSGYERFVKKFFSKTESFEKNFTCTECGHIQENEDCLCGYCRRDKRELVINSYTLEEARKLKKFNLKEKVYLATILQGLLVSSGDSEFSYKKGIFPCLFFNEDYFVKILKSLTLNNILVVSPTSPIESFKQPSMTDDFPMEVYLNRVNYSLKNLKLLFSEENEKWFNELKFPSKIEYTLSQKQELWETIVVNELVKLFNYQLEANNLSYAKWNPDKHKEQEEAIKIEIKNLLINNKYTPAQVYELLWRGIRQSITRREQIKAKRQLLHHRDDDVQLVIVYGIRSILKYNSDIILKGYEHPKVENLSTVTRVFFEQILKQQNWFYTSYPTGDSKNIESFLLGLSDEEKQKLKEKIDN